LAQPGKNGTLKSRLKNLKGKVFAKTGTLKKTAALSGFIEAPQGTIVFCVMSDYLDKTLAAERARIDSMVTQNYNRAR
jgi:D-alanyl-D-alanine carboxypeptidase/D-alanyl-D-alanine-endopeptidase (penicillin-binding protein 4)